MAEPVESRVRANGIDHHVIAWEGGDRGTVVLCHGFLDIAWSWDRVARRLAAEGFRAVAFDWRGHGESSWVGEGGYYHFPDYILDLDELLPRLDPGRVHLVGHSMGGTACSMYAGTTCERLRTLSLVEGIGPLAHPLDVVPDRFGAFLRTVRNVRSRPPRVMRDVDEAFARMRVQNPDLPDELGRFLAERSTRPAPSGDGLVWSFDPLHRTRSPMPFALESYRAFLRRIAVPTLVVGASRGFRVPDEAERVAELPDARTVEIDGAGHMIHWLAPDALADALLGFLP